MACSLLSIWTTLTVHLQITQHAAAAAKSTSNRVSISCNCKAACTGRCRCKKNQVQCSIHCHSDEHDCGNLSPLAICTEIALVARSRPVPVAAGRKRTNTTVVGQKTGRVTRGRHVEGSESEEVDEEDEVED
jgi:hypothetical protein